jgi:hypothetical protein
LEHREKATARSLPKRAEHGISLKHPRPLPIFRLHRAVHPASTPIGEANRYDFESQREAQEAQQAWQTRNRAARAEGMAISIWVWAVAGGLSAWFFARLIHALIRVATRVGL